MEEKKIGFKSDNLNIEGLISIDDLDKGVVITHPHPLYGGDMNNVVVAAIKDAYQSLGFKTLRFNFRGTMGSEGSHEDGVGETEDVKQAVNYLKNQGCKRVDLAGYSFGTFVNSMYESDDIDSMMMVSPPVDFIEFRKDLKLAALKLIISGKNDGFAHPLNVEKNAKEWNSDHKLIFIDNCDHFFGGSLKTLKDLIISNIE